jgi:hypothetical protein
MNIGKKIGNKNDHAPAPQPKYKPHPTNPNIVINSATGKWETRQPLPPGPVWPFPIVKPDIDLSQP